MNAAGWAQRVGVAAAFAAAFIPQGASVHSDAEGARAGDVSGRGAFSARRSCAFAGRAAVAANAGHSHVQRGAPVGVVEVVKGQGRRAGAGRAGGGDTGVRSAASADRRLVELKRLELKRRAVGLAADRILERAARAIPAARALGRRRREPRLARAAAAAAAALLRYAGDGRGADPGRDRRGLRLRGDAPVAAARAWSYAFAAIPSVAIRRRRHSLRRVCD